MNKTVVFLCSGGGGNLRFVHKAIYEKWISRWSKIVVIADRECPAINYARKEGFDNFIVDFKEFNQIELIKITSALKPDMIITTVNRILSRFFLEKFEGHLINLHYSLLPAFSGTIGAKSVQDAQNFGSCITGATIHDVTETVDCGPPRVQIALPIYRQDTSEDAMDIIFRAGCIALLTALIITDKPELRFLNGGHLLINGRPALINPIVKYPVDVNNESIWVALKS